MSEVSLWRLYLLRGMYLLLAVGLALMVWPSIIAPPDSVANAKTVIRSLGGAGPAVRSGASISAEDASAPSLRATLEGHLGRRIRSSHVVSRGLDDYASETLFACLMGVVLVLIVVPWGYVFRHYFKAPADPWR